MNTTDSMNEVIDETTVVRTTEMHSAGEPLRIVESGYPPIIGETILEKRRYVQRHLDHLRRFLIFEPRGHHDMYGAILVKPDLPEADIAALFMHNEGYSTMCGHAVMALSRYAVDRGMVSGKDLQKKGEVQVNIQCPCGLVKAFVEYKNGKTGRTRFHSVAAFAFKLDAKVVIPNLGVVSVDIGYGGAFYAIVSDRSLGVDVRQTNTVDLIRVGSAVSEAVRSTVELHHPNNEDLAFLYGTIITDGQDDYSSEPTVNFSRSNREINRAPTGSGVTARVAVQYARKQLAQGQIRQFESAATGSLYSGKVVGEGPSCGQFPTVIVEVSGTSYYTGSSTYTAELEDNLRAGFVLKSAHLETGFSRAPPTEELALEEI